MYVRRASLFIPFNTKKEILLQHRTKDAPFYPDYWGFFGGEIDEGESPEEAVIREANEELEIEVKEITLFKRYEISEDRGVFERFAFLYPLSETEDELRKKQHEGDDLKFFPIDTIKEIKFNQFNIVIVEDIADYFSSHEEQI